MGYNPIVAKVSVSAQRMREVRASALALLSLLFITTCDHSSSTATSENKLSTSEFKAKRVSRTSTITLNAPLERVFPLFGPIKEMEWAEGWSPKIIYSNTDSVEEHMVFTTQSHAHGEPAYTWILSKYAPEQALVEYTVSTPERIWTITVQCNKDTAAQTTLAEVTYTYTGLTEKGNAINEKALNAMYAHDLKDWEEAINHYLKTGEKLGHH